MRHSGAYKVIGVLLPVAVGAAAYAYFTWKKKPKSALPKNNSTAKSRSEKLKNEGNTLYRSKDYEGALKLYKEALELCSKENTKLLSILYANMAAVYEALKNYEKSVEFCNKALELDNLYVKALHRRATCEEHLGEINKAMEDYAAVSVLNAGNPNEELIKKLDALIMKVSVQRAKNLLKERTHYQVSPYLIKTFIDSLFPDDCILGKEARDAYANNEQFTESHFAAALKKLDVYDCYGGIDECNEEIKLSEKSHFYWEAKLLRGTFFFFVADDDNAMKDFNDIIENYAKSGEKLCLAAHLRKAAVYLQDMSIQASTAEIESALAIDSNRGYTYAYMGQVLMLSGRFNEALTWFDKALASCPDSPKIKAQKYIVKCKLERDNNQAYGLAQSMREFSKLVEENPDIISIRLEYAQVLSEYGVYDQAAEQLEIALEHAPEEDKGQILVQKASHILSYSADSKKAETILLEALKKDAAYETIYHLLGFLYLQRNDIDSAIEYFKKSANLGRREELIAYAFHVVTSLEIQKTLMEKFNLNPDQCSKFLKSLNFKWLNLL